MTPEPVRPDPPRPEARLEELLAEAEETVARLRAELEAERDRAATDDLAAQHAEIARLSEHLEHARVRWSEVREFFEAAMREVTARRGAVGRPDGHPEVG